MSYDAAASKRFREANREHLRAKARERYWKKRDHILAYLKKYNEEKPEVAKAWKAANKDRIAGYNRKRLYGITEEQYQAQLRYQDGLCALCGRPESARGRFARLSVDHDHETGQPRGLLCLGCNLSLGYFERGWKSKLDPELARRYLSRYYWQGV